MYVIKNSKKKMITNFLLSLQDYLEAGVESKDEIYMFTSGLLPLEEIKREDSDLPPQ